MYKHFELVDRCMYLQQFKLNKLHRKLALSNASYSTSCLSCKTRVLIVACPCVHLLHSSLICSYPLSKIKFDNTYYAIVSYYLGNELLINFILFLLNIIIVKSEVSEMPKLICCIEICIPILIRFIFSL